MIRVSVKEFRSRLKEMLEMVKKEPIEVTNWGEVVAIVYTPQENFVEKINLLKKYIVELEAEIKNNPQNNSKDEYNVYTSPSTNVTTYKPIGKCDKCFKQGALNSRLVPTEINGEEKDIEMQLCPKCVRNLDRFLS